MSTKAQTKKQVKTTKKATKITEAVDAAQVKASIEGKLIRYFGVEPYEATPEQMYKAVVYSVKDILQQKRGEFRERTKKAKGKKIYYLCMEFLVGRTLKNALMNLGVEDEYREVLAEMGHDLSAAYDSDPDLGLGNGGLGRLAACFMDSLTTLDYAATGFSICYEYGFFKQKLIDGNQVELPDMWMDRGEAWLNPRNDKSFTVRFGGNVKENWDGEKCDIIYENYQEVKALPYDLLISGSGTDAVNNLRLWKAVDTTTFNMSLISQGQYVRAMQETSSAEIISKVLYPSDDHDEGKLLRLSQQYFLVSASLQNIIADHLAAYGTLSNFADKVAIHINDTHPALCIPELMRILIDTYSYSWNDAWRTVTRVVSYTNHTVLPEALEKWNVDLFRLKLPRIYMIVEEINRRLCADLWKMYPGDWDRISRMSIIAYNQVRMANMSVVASHTINGVSALHSDILKKTVFHDFYKAYPDRFTNVTNGIAHRRWLCYSNRGLSSLLDETIGSDYRWNPEKLADFKKYENDAAVAERLREIKAENKLAFAKHWFNKTGVALDVNSVFDTQVKRMHEYKRQLLNVLKVLALYAELKNNPNANITPTTFIFGGKAASGYQMAKNIIRLIWSLGEEIAKDPVARDILKVIYVEEYNVTESELLMPATDISEQISLAGKEASGTGCMKFMINGALTLGTLDGANVEMREAVGDDNIYIFGLTDPQVEDLWRRGYESVKYYMQSDRLHAAIDLLSQKTFAGNDFRSIVSYLLYSHGVSDPYMCLADFDSYISTFDRMMKDYAEPDKWTKKSLINIAGAGYFAADRSIKDYADKIWHINKIK
ncbi:MAG: glycogen/starch/alpha-glucan phosphorylase [Clostridia bacterium]|nr:glycogen/starch/alpha-glucan phosphorylase [Clostridia bacterium]